MKNIQPYLFALLIFITACSKKIDSKTSQSGGTVLPVTKTGSASGKVSPAGAFKLISFILLDSGKIFVTNHDSVTGLFDQKNLPEGKYMLKFETGARYNSLPVTSVDIVKGKNTDLGLFTVKEATFAVRYEVDGIFEGIQYKASYSGENLSIGPLIVSTYPEDMRILYYLTIRLKGVTGVGTYVCNGSSSTIAYSGVRLGNGIRISYQSTEYTGGKGSVTITSVDSTTRTVKGSFSGTLVSSSGKVAEITKGVINTTY